MSIYSSRFYSTQVNPSYVSALSYAKCLFDIIKIESIVDVGCGRGPWLKAFSEIFSLRPASLLGIDGPWNTRERLEVDADYIGINLDRLEELKVDRKFDLAICVEVAEHLHPNSAGVLIQELCSLSDVVIFSAATKHQGGIGHRNEIYPSEWAHIFHDNGYLVYDYFRPLLWGISSIRPWYLQSIFLYIRRDSKVSTYIQSLGYSPMLNAEFMNCVHHALFESRSSFFGFAKYKLHEILPDAIVHWIAILYNVAIKIFANPADKQL
jgi:hypothetical protein